MNKIETIVFALISVFTTAVAFDFIVFVLKSGAKASYFSKLSWRIGLLTASALVYWYINGMKFL